MWWSWDFFSGVKNGENVSSSFFCYSFWKKKGLKTWDACRLTETFKLRRKTLRSSPLLPQFRAECANAYFFGETWASFGEGVIPLFPCPGIPTAFTHIHTHVGINCMWYNFLSSCYQASLMVKAGVQAFWRHWYALKAQFTQRTINFLTYPWQNLPIAVVLFAEVFEIFFSEISEFLSSRWLA